ncbi:MAG TPA: hypothetical protein VIG06_09625 [Kofleriaceae bacterium]
MSRSRTRLRLHRETLRVLAADELDRVNGGYKAELTEGPVWGSQPKSNAWTGAVPADAYCGAFN